MAAALRKACLVSCTGVLISVCLAKPDAVHQSVLPATPLERACPSTCARGSVPTLSCPFILYHIPKTGGSALRHIIHLAASQHNVSAFIPCHGDIPCVIGGFELDSMMECFERQSASGFDDATLKVCMHAALQTDHWTLALQHLPQASASRFAENPVPLTVFVVRSLSCASVVAGHITPSVLTRASDMFRRLQGSQLARSVGLCAGPNLACASCWTTVREPLSRTASHIRHFHPAVTATRQAAADDVIKVLALLTNASAVADYVGSNLQSTYVTPNVLQKCGIMMFETLQHDIRVLFASQPWLGTHQLPVINARPRPHADDSKAIQALANFGLKRWLRKDIELYGKALKQRQSQKRV